MPALGADMTEGSLVEWLVQPGDTVVKGQAVAVVDTAKSAIEVECFEDGAIQELLVEPGTTVPVGTVLAVLADSGRTAAPAGATETAETAETADAAETAEIADAAETVKAAGTAKTTERGAARTTPLVRRLAHDRHVDLDSVRGSGKAGRVTRADVEAAGRDSGRVRATPYARRTASELGLDLRGVNGTGTEGTIRARDVRAAASSQAAPARPASPAPAAAPQPAEAPQPAVSPEPPAPDGHAQGRRQAIAHLMSKSKHEIPHYYLSTTIDLAAAVAWMREHNRAVPVAERLVPAALLLKAAAVAARRVPEVNGFWIDGEHVRPAAVHLGVAVSLREGGLAAPALHDADTLSLPALMAGLRDLVRRARTGRLRASETADPTITVTDLGDQGVEAVFGVIYPPQVALVGYGRVLDRPVAVDGLLGVHPCVTATLSADHRAGDGAVGARYLATVDRLLRHPEDL